MGRWTALISFVFFATLCMATDAATFTHVKIHRHRNPEDRVLVDKVGVLTFDDAGRRLTFKSDAGDTLDVSYDAVAKVIFEVTSHMRGGALAQVVSAASFPGLIAGTLIAGQHVHDYWFYLEYKNGDHNEPILLDVPKDSSEAVITKATSLFGSRVTVAEFQEKGEEIKRKELPDIRSKQILKVKKVDHPLPELKPDKATIVVVCPPLAARYSGKGRQYKLHANDHVIAVNRSGTYSFAYLDPGKYHLVSQADNANGFEIELQAGQVYYFLQNTFQSDPQGGRTVLSRNTPELVLYELSGSYFADWKRK
ncbi:MAG: DUF2846 domain-containing protein [Acidobacteriia bacterium]|nr:DUF2846 domain-containing protein [Terriglobia bacterium]